MDGVGYACMINVKSLNAQIRLEGSSTEHSQWTSLPQCPVGWAGPTLSSLSGQCLALSLDGIFQLQERQWVRIGDMCVPSKYCIVCVVCDQMVVVGGYTDPLLTGLTSTDAVRVAVIV